MRARRIPLVGLILLGAFAACGSPDGAPPDCSGEESCSCLSDGTCRAGLVCLSDRCVDPEGAGGGGQGGTPPASGGDAGEGGVVGGTSGAPGGGSPAGEGGAPSEGGAPAEGGAPGSGGSDGGESTGGEPETGGSTGGGGAPEGGGPGNGGSAGSPEGGAGETGGSAGAPGACPMIGDLEHPVVYDGGDPSDECVLTNTPPFTGDWYSYADDGTMPLIYAGNGDETDGINCALHTSGDGYLIWGDGIGTDIGTADCPFDASAFTGIRVRVKGSLWYTRDASLESGSAVRLQLETAQATGSDPFGRFCAVTGSWTTCQFPFSSLVQEGLGATVTPPIDKTTILKIQIQILRADVGDPDVGSGHYLWIDDVGFY